MRIGLQMYSLRRDCAKDFFGTLEKVADVGFEGVEFAGFFGKSAGEVKDKLNELGLSVAGSHTSLNSVILWAYDRTIAYNRELGNKYIIVPGVPEELIQGKQDWYSLASFLNGFSKELFQQGIQIGYHNHQQEFHAVDGERPWDILGKNTQEVVLQLDVGHAADGLSSVEEAIAQLDKYPGRSKTVHAKEFSKEKGYNVVLGEGDIDWQSFLEACKRNGTEWVILEQEQYPYNPPIESVKRGFAKLSELMKSI